MLLLCLPYHKQLLQELVFLTDVSNLEFLRWQLGKAVKNAI